MSALTCKQCQMPLDPWTEVDGSQRYSGPKLVVRLAVEHHEVDFIEGHPAGDRCTPVDAGVFCSTACLAVYLQRPAGAAHVLVCRDGQFQQAVGHKTLTMVCTTCHPEFLR